MSKDIVGHVEGTIPNPIPKKYLKQLSSRKTTAPVSEGNGHVVLTFSPMTAVYAAHHHKCVQVNSKKVHAIDEKFPSVKAAHDWADRDESDKAGEPTKARFKSCACAKGLKEDTAGFADASAPSNSSYQTQLSPTQTAKKPQGKKKMKTIKEFLKVSEAASICAACNNTGVMKKFGNNMICDQCTAGTDKRVDQENLMFKQARDMLSVGKTIPVAEAQRIPGEDREEDKKHAPSRPGIPGLREPLADYKKNLAKKKKIKEDTVNELSSKLLNKYIGKRIHSKNAPTGKKRENSIKGVERAENKIEKREKAEMRHEEVITSVDDVKDILEGYKVSDKLKARTKYLVQPKLSQMLKDRLAARAADTKTKKGGYTPSRGTLGLAAARRAQMSHAKKKDIEEGVVSEGDPAHWKGKNTNNSKYLPAAPGTYAADKAAGKYKAFKKAAKERLNAAKKTNEEKKPKALSSHVKGKELPALSMKPQMGSSNDNRMSEETINQNSDKNYSNHSEWENVVKKHHGPDVKFQRSPGKAMAFKNNKQIAHFSPGPGKEKWIEGIDKKQVKEDMDINEKYEGMEHMSDAAHELVMHADNHAQLHHGSHMPIIRNLARKKAKGTYDSEKAKKLWHSHADRAAQSYHKEYGDKHQPWHKMFTTDDRKQAAHHWEAAHRDELHEEVVNELSKKTLGSYIKKSTNSAVKNSGDAREAGFNDRGDKIYAKVEKRTAGIRKATDRLTKEEIMSEAKKKAVSWNPPEVVARFAKEKKEAKQFAGAKREIDRLKKRNEEVEFLVDGELKKFTGEGKSGLKRKYLGKMRGRTDTGKPAHAIEIDPVLKTGKRDLDKQVR
jgi:hypothetical protein